MDDDNFEISGSSEDEEMDELLLDSLRNKKFYNEKDTLFGFGSEGEEDEAVSSSDIDDHEDKLPDDRAWGQKRKHFYNTDYVDQDYTGTLGADDAEAAEMEENEARNIQKRLMEQLTDEDFSLAEFGDIPQVASQNKAEVIQTDLSQLSKRQKQELFKKESPEFENLVGDFIEKITEAHDRIFPILTMSEQGKIRPSPALDFIETKLSIILNYCVNIVFYVLLKTKRVPFRDHPVLKCLFRYRQLLSQLQPVEEEIIKPQVDNLLELFKECTSEQKSVDADTAVEEVEPKKVKKAKKVLKILKKTIENSKQIVSNKVIEETTNPGTDSIVESLPVSESDQSEVEEDAVMKDTNKSDKRAITYEMAKNKGLTPKRSKEQRNPRVKHRNKFRKANIRRRGQVRTARTEIPVYTGEPTGIKIGLKKGRKIM